MVRIPTDREPTHPGEMLRHEFLLPLGITQRVLADAIHVPYQRVNEIVRGKRGVSPTTALRLGKVLRTDPGFWMNLQVRCPVGPVPCTTFRLINGTGPATLARAVPSARVAHIADSGLLEISRTSRPHLPRAYPLLHLGI
jgi:addiction module HigA family antidote